MRLLLTTVALLSLVSPGYAQLAMPNEAGLTYSHVHLNVSDVEFHKQVWVEHFGGVVSDRGSAVAVRLPGFLVALSAREPTGGSVGSVLDHFGFKVRNMEKFLAKWRAAGYSVDSEFTGAEGQPNAYVTIPDGVLVELQGRPDAAGGGLRLSHPLLHNGVRGAARLVSRRLRARAAAAWQGSRRPPNVPGINIELRQRA